MVNAYLYILRGNVELEKNPIEVKKYKETTKKEMEQIRLFKF